jgi:hypothetical protein
MTNTEKYQEVFGFPPDKGKCPAESCEVCPSKVVGKSICIYSNWWNEEYKEKKND